MDREHIGNGGFRRSTDQESVKKSSETKKTNSGKVIHISAAYRKRANSSSVPESIRSAIEYADSLKW